MISGEVTLTFRAAIAIATAEQALQAGGYQVVCLRETDSFARPRIHHQPGQVLDVDLAVNWRADSPVRLSLGLVLSERGAVTGKLSGYWRGEIRDFSTSTRSGPPDVVPTEASWPSAGSTTTGSTRRCSPPGSPA